MIMGRAPSLAAPAHIPAVDTLWAGALTSDGATVVVQTFADHPRLQLAATGPGGTFRSAVTATSSRTAKLAVAGLTAASAYTWRIEADGIPVGPSGGFTTLPSAGPASFTCAFGGDQTGGSNSVVYDAIVAKQPRFYVMMGDIHYANISTDNQILFQAQHDLNLHTARQAALYRGVPTVYVWDDHDYGAGNSSSSSAAKDAVSRVYRARVPHYPLADSAENGPIYHSFVVGRVRFVVTDQRHAASTQGATDNSSKTVLGSAQKTWWKSQVSAAAAAGQVVVWVCPRVVGGPMEVGADHWGGYTTERTELWNYIKANALGRVAILAADMHSLGIDDGTNHNFATGGGCPVPCFQCAPLDQTTHTTYAGPPTYSETGLISQNGVFGTMAVTDVGGAVGIHWRGHDSAGDTIAEYEFEVTV